MNRQQRRAMQKRQEAEAKYLRQIEERQNLVDKQTITFDYVCLSLTLHELFGFGYQRINRVIQEINRRKCTVLNEGRTLADLAKELADKTGIEIAVE